MKAEIDTILTEARWDYEAGKFKEAAKKYRMILEVNPESALAHQGLAECLCSLGQYEEAIEECNRALKLDPRLAIPHGVLGSIYCRQRRFEEGERELRKAIELDPALEKAYVSLGATLGEQGRLQEAVSVLERALELNPKRSITHHNLSVTYVHQKRYFDALREAFRAFQLGPSIRRGLEVVLVVLIYLGTEHPRLFSLLVCSFLLLSFVIRSLLTLPFLALVIGYFTFGAISELRSGKRTRGMVLLLLVVALAVLYAYNLVYGLSSRSR